MTFGTVLFIVLMPVLMLGVFAWAAQRQMWALDARDSELLRLAERSGGEAVASFKAAPEANGKAIQLPSPAGPFLVYHVAGLENSEIPFTRARATRPWGSFPRLEIFPEQLVHSIAKRLGMQDIQIGDEEIDDLFILQAEDEKAVRGLLANDEARTILLRGMRAHGWLHLECLPDRLTFTVRGWLEDKQLDTFRDRMIKLLTAFSRLELPPAGTPLLLEPSHPGESAACLVCGGSIALKPHVRCTSCETPHHAECWDYNGGCAVYGCRSTTRAG